ncbi:hypothetical protein SOM10_11990 [Microbacterium sp. CFBP9023]|uniref:hypothetical protein n=1 Tax=Microbacterium sp. CFBP9023 TaxID=3096535 RepID=UPI002A69B70F|nr:hypothetical protein [Microbacterium sp. CFBP9023]MDY0984616.1 hypothetical protein [Microbacterium sp. CFBP9023]
MTSEFAGITIIVDQGSERTVVNIPKSDLAEMFYQEPQLPTTPAALFDPWFRPPPPRIVGFRFRPVAPFTIREETVPMRATPATDLSEHEQAEADRFGIHEDGEVAL